MKLLRFLRPHDVGAPGHEDAFIEHYEYLHTRARRMKSGDAELARELVHEAFIQFVLRQPDLSAIKNLRAYLHGMVVHLGELEWRREARERLEQFPERMEELEKQMSAVHPDMSTDLRDFHRRRDDLRALCQYACMRKEKSKAGSVLILRFFHGYYIDEVAKLLCISEHAATELLRCARVEAKRYAEDPDYFGDSARRATAGRGRFGKSAKVSDLERGSRGNGELSLLNLFDEMRSIIFESRHGSCLTDTQFETWYESGADSSARRPLDRQTAAHLVSCQHCLEAVNRLLRLPPPVTRYPDDALDSGSRSGGRTRNDQPTAASGRQYRTKKSEFIEEHRRRLRAVSETYPQELRVVVNGSHAGQQRVSPEWEHLTLNIKVEEQPGLIEVFSERNVRLFYMAIDLPRSETERTQRQRVILSDDRVIEAVASFSDDDEKMALRLGYSNPLYGESFPTNAALTVEYDLLLEHYAASRGGNFYEAPDVIVTGAVDEILEISCCCATERSPQLAGESVAPTADPETGDSRDESLIPAH